MDISDQTILPPCQPDQTFVSVSPIDGGSITLPERFFVSPSDPDAKSTVPSMAFLITHPTLNQYNNGQTDINAPSIQIMFDLGLRSRIERYIPAQQSHLNGGRKPYQVGPGAAACLADGGLRAASDIDLVILSHVHYDHHGDPEDFPNSLFIVGNGSLALLDGQGAAKGSHQHFDPSLLSRNRTLELTHPRGGNATINVNSRTLLQCSWKAVGPFEAALDLFGDGSLFIVDSPGHLPGHLNLLCRTGPRNWVYLGGDTCHDLRLLTGERAIGFWEDAEGNSICIHTDSAAAEETIRRVKQLSDMKESNDVDIDVVMAHDLRWYEQNKHRFFPNLL